MSGRYRHDPNHPARLNQHGAAEPTRQPRFHTRLYCIVWEEHDVLKVGLGSGTSDRSRPATESLARYLSYEGVSPGPFDEWRADLPTMEGAPWGDCQPLEMVFATAVKRRLGATAACAIGLEWLTREHLDEVNWNAVLDAAAADALHYSRIDCSAAWICSASGWPVAPLSAQPAERVA